MNNMDNIICPGETIKELLEVNNLTQNDLADKLGLELKTVNLILNGKAPITNETAFKLEMIFGIDASFFNNLEFNYRKKLNQFANQEVVEKEYERIKDVYKELVKRNLVHESKDKYIVVDNFKKFMEIVSLKKKKKEYYKVFCRKANVSNFDYINLLVWIQIGLRKARNIEIKDYNKKLILEKIDEIKELTKLENQEEARKKLYNICKECGIIVLFEKSMPKTAIYGIAKWLDTNKPIIQISDRGKNVATFWFSFMHELGHILNGRKKGFFIDYDKENDLSENVNLGEDEIILNQVEEFKADKFANNNLIPEKEFKKFFQNKNFSKDSIIDFANKNSIAPCIVAGRLEHELNNYSDRILNSFRIKNEF